MLHASNNGAEFRSTSIYTVLRGIEEGPGVRHL